ncbi:PRC and DUF2382 domain-containing protein [Nonomuraea sp. NN258]|uniref:DUF2382 domain-containing protein n=1 Tax=Nonomuraea antri TaxID=2730852 RepID=UPI001567F556|nr:PRC and DUF2382 domain-containing protein [Nonomuraea antri]NRQ39518.1 PRC and DUF2382 domain-containing protein [Nonomuraea antri]
MALQTEIRNLLDCHVVGSDGQHIGKVGQVYLNDRSGEPEWVTVRTGLFGTKQTFVPLANARRSGEEIRVPFDKEMIKGAPNIDVDGRLSLEEEADLYRYYGMQPSNIPTQRKPEQGRAQAGERTGAERRGRATGDRDIDITRSEEQLHVGKESRETGRVRLHKYVETEDVQQNVPLSHEEVTIERRPIREGERVTPHEIGEEDEEIILYEERPVVGKETKPVERVHVHKEKVERQETVRGQVRKERLEVDEDGSVRNQDDIPPER